MALTGRDLELERRRLKEVLKLLDDKIARMGKDIFLDEEKLQDFRRYTWENKKSMDAQELSQANVENDMETNNLLREREYFKKLCRIKDNPYFGRFDFKESGKNNETIYIGKKICLMKI